MPILEENGIDIRTVISFPKNYRDKTPLKYTCVCGSNVERSCDTIKTRPLCNTCCPPKKTGPKTNTLEQFIELADRCGYEYVAIKGEFFVNTKSSMTVKNIKTGEICRKSYNNLQQGIVKSKKDVDNDKKKSIDEIETLYLENGWKWVEGTVYINNKTPIPAICHCGNRFEVAVCNIHENRIGCPQCYRYNRKYSWEYIEGYADKCGCTVSQLPDEPYRGRDTRVHMFCACGQEVIKTAKQVLKSPRCKQCSCKFGEDNFFGTEYGKNAVKAYWMKKHNVDHNMKVPEIQLKSQDTCMKNYDVNCVLKLKQVRDWAADAHFEKWGAPQGCVKEHHDKRKATNKERYNNECFLASNQGKETMIRLYDYPYALQNADLLDKQQRSARRFKPYTFPSGRTELIQGYENLCLDYLLNEECIDEDDIVVSRKQCPEIMYDLDGKRKRYFMDIYIKSQDRGIEVKSTFTYFREQEKNMRKWTVASGICTEFDIFVFEKKGLIAMKRLKDGENIGYCMGKDAKEYRKIPMNTIYTDTLIPAMNIKIRRMCKKHGGKFEYVVIKDITKRRKDIVISKYNNCMSETVKSRATEPIIINNENGVMEMVDGNHRCTVAENMGYTRICAIVTYAPRRKINA